MISTRPVWRRTSARYWVWVPFVVATTAAIEGGIESASPRTGECVTWREEGGAAVSKAGTPLVLKWTYVGAKDDRLFVDARRVGWAKGVRDAAELGHDLHRNLMKGL